MKEIKVVKGNVEYRIPEHKKKEYLDMGYSVLDAQGKVAIQGRPVTMADYKQRVAELEALVKEQDEQLALLAADNSAKDGRVAELTYELNKLKNAGNGADGPSDAPKSEGEGFIPEAAETAESEPQVAKKGKAAKKAE